MAAKKERLEREAEAQAIELRKQKEDAKMAKAIKKVSFFLF